MFGIFATRLLRCSYSKLHASNKWFSAGALKISNAKLKFEKLDRSLINVSGRQANEFLQGLITNDMRHLEEGNKSMYAVFLNLQGRILYDTIIYKNEEDNSFWIECDSAITLLLEKHLNKYVIRKKIDINVWEGHNVWALFNPKVICEQFVTDQNCVPNVLTNEVDDICRKLKIISFRDPRLALLGYRAIVPHTVNLESGMKLQNSGIYDMSYRSLRFNLGIAEGSVELPPGKCFPLEANCDYLHGISFHKGCYIGQELTARIHHTGVIRKRIMPLYFDNLPSSKFSPDTPIIEDSTKKIVGKLRGLEQSLGLGLLRIAEALKAQKLYVGDYSCSTIKPTWWPHEAPRDVKSVVVDAERVSV